MTSINTTSERRRELLRVVFSMSLIIIGTAHFLRAEQFARIVPPVFPTYFSVYISGVFEILGGIGLLIPSVSVAAAWGLIALFIAVFPANIYMALHNIKLDGVPPTSTTLLGTATIASGFDCLGLVVHKASKAAPSQSVTGGTESN